MSSSHIPNAVIGGVLVSLSYSLFYFIHSHHLSLGRLFWTVTVLKKSTHIIKQSGFSNISQLFRESSSLPESSSTGWPMKGLGR